MAETRFHMAAEPCAIMQLECWADSSEAFGAAIAARLGGELPAEVGEVRSMAGLKAVRIAPRRLWLIGDEAVPALSVDPDLGCALPLSEGRVRLHLSGRHLLDVLSACVAIDWNGPQAAPGRAVQTGFHRVPVLALRTASDACDLVVPRSFERSLTEWISDSAAAHA